MTINEHEYAKLLTGKIVKADWTPDINRQTLHLEDGCMIQIEDGKMRLYNSGGAMLLPEPKPESTHVIITEDVTIRYKIPVEELPNDLRHEPGEGDLLDWFCELDSGDVERYKEIESVDHRSVEEAP